MTKFEVNKIYYDDLHETKIRITRRTDTRIWFNFVYSDKEVKSTEFGYNYKAIKKPSWTECEAIFLDDFGITGTRYYANGETI